MTFAAAEFAAATPATSTDTESRTITGLALPYNATARKFGIAVRFLPGSLEYGDVGRVKHLQDHVTPVGSVLSLEDTDAGLVAKLSVLGGPEGSPVKAARDQLLHDAAGGLYDGLSVGVDFSYDPEDGDVTYNEDTDTYDVQRATLREISSTPYMPAFDDARVTRVAASRTPGGDTVDPCQHCGQRHAPGIACATFAAQLRTTAPAAPATPATPVTPVPRETGPDMAAAFAAFVAAGAGQAPEGPTPVNPHRAPLEVREASPYRFDRYGNLRAGSHDFSSDLFNGWSPAGPGDQAARDRAESFLRAAFANRDFGNALLPESAGEQFAITPANVVNLNYPQNRPDLYVDQLDYQYPLYAGSFKGTLDTVTPFVIPKFSTSSGLVADHVTGTEPTPGAFTATAQTITPSAVSGKVEITREAFDQGGNPQMSGLIWRQMVRGWYEALEAYVQAQLLAAAASIPDITITASSADAVLDASLAGNLVPLQYIRGGDRYRIVFTQIDLFTAMVKAKDSTGRRLYPSLGAHERGGHDRPRLQLDRGARQALRPRVGDGGHLRRAHPVMDVRPRRRLPLGVDPEPHRPPVARRVGRPRHLGIQGVRRDGLLPHARGAVHPLTRSLGPTRPRARRVASPHPPERTHPMAETKDDVTAERDALRAEVARLREVLATQPAGSSAAAPQRFVLSEGDRQELVARGVASIGGRLLTRDQVRERLESEQADVELGDGPVDPALVRLTTATGDRQPVYGVTHVYPSLEPGGIDPKVAGTPGISGPPASDSAR
jgi:hypothetical protein